MASLSLADCANERGAILHTLRRIAPWASSPEDLASDVVLGLLEAHARQPSLRVRKPWNAIKYRVLDVVRSEAKRVMRVRQWPEYDIELACPPNQLLGERMQERANEELAAEGEAEVLERMRSESPSERGQRELMTCRALGTIPGGFFDVVEGRV